MTAAPLAPLTWREKTVLRVLCLIALMLTRDERIASEIRSLATHISVSRESGMP